MLTSEAKREITNNPNYYENITQNFPDTIPSPYLGQIEADLLRSYPEDPFYFDQSNINSMRRILLAFSRRNISIGYCQGFNFIVGKLFKILLDEVVVIKLGSNFLDFCTIN